MRRASAEGSQTDRRHVRSFLAGFETVYHINGQQTVSIQGDKATGTAYCLVVLIGGQNG